MTRRVPSLAALRGAVAAGIAVVTLLGGCAAGPTTRFHTLMPAAGTAGPQVAPTGALAWEVLPVNIPAQVDQPQWVVRAADGSLAVLEQERWIAPLAEEFRAAVTDRLTQILGAPAASAEPRKRWRVRIDVQRFESSPGREARLEATWTVNSLSETAISLRCRDEFVATATSGDYLALAKAHQQGVAKLADDIGSALKALSAGQLASCRG